MTVQLFEEKVLKGALNMISPDVMVDDGKGTVLISSEEGETTANMNKLLAVSRNLHDSLTFHIFIDCFRVLLITLGFQYL